jgi:hypothetical protein
MRIRIARFEEARSRHRSATEPLIRTHAAEGSNLLELNLAFDFKRETNPAERHCRLGR